LDANILGGRYSHVAVADPDKRPKERFAAIAVDLLTNPKERPKKNLVIKYCSPSQFTEIVSNEEPQFHRNGGWYQYHLSITKLPETGRFEVSATFSLLNKKGTKVQSELATIDSQIINNADLYAQDRLVAGIGLLHSPTNTGVERQYDDFTIKVSSASTVALPEPASLLPLGFGLGLYLLGRRRLRA